MSSTITSARRGIISHRYAPAFFTSRAHALGAAPSTIACRRCAPSRSRMRCIGCEHYRFDGLRLDAVHCHRRAGRAVDPARSQPGGRGFRRRHRAHDPSRAGERRQPREPARSATRSAARTISRAMERRLSPRLARAADRRGGRLLSRITPRIRAGISRACWPRALPIRASPPPHRDDRTRGEPSGQLVAARVRQFPAEPRPDRQPSARRSPGGAGRARLR